MVIPQAEYVNAVRGKMADRFRDITGMEDVSGIEVALLLRSVSNSYENLESRFMTHLELSGPRWAILMLLLENEKNGDFIVTPTVLSRSQSVKKNTISSMLKKLETDGLVERSLDPGDKRLFRIHLTRKGKAIAEKYAPEFAIFQNRLAGVLNSKERDDLVHLLAKLLYSLGEQKVVQD